MIFTSSPGWESWEGPSTHTASVGLVCCTWLELAGLLTGSGWSTWSAWWYLGDPLWYCGVGSCAGIASCRWAASWREVVSWGGAGLVGRGIKWTSTTRGTGARVRLGVPTTCEGGMTWAMVSSSRLIVSLAKFFPKSPSSSLPKHPL